MEKVKITNLKIIEKASPVGTNNAAFFYMLFNNDEPNESQHKVFFAFANKVKEN
jgi:hypothetical protein